MEGQMMYGRKGTTQSDTSKYWKKTGPGLREQLQDSWTKTYSGIPTADLFKDYLLDIYYSREDIDNRETVMMEGQLGSLFFHDALASQAASFLTVDSHFVKEYDRSRRYLSYGAQFKHYTGQLNVVITLEVID